MLFRSPLLRTQLALRYIYYYYYYYYWTVRGSDLGEGEIFCTSPDQAWGTPGPCKKGTGSLMGGKAEVAGFDNPFSSTAKDEVRVELYFYSPSGFS